MPGARFDTWRDLPEIHAYFVMPSVDGRDELWHGGGGGLVATVEPHHVQACLDAKSALYEVYRGKAPEVWLLIVNDMTHGAACELGVGVATVSYDCPFDRAFWLELVVGRVVELSIMGSTTGAS